MNTNRLQFLIQKKLKGECSFEEMQELAHLIEKSDNELLKKELWHQWETYSGPVTLSEKKTRRILNEITSTGNKPEAVPARKKISLYRIAAIAASFALLVWIGKAGYECLRPVPPPAVVIAANPVPSNQVTDYNRTITLFDGSTVILKSGSTLDSQIQLNDSTREVFLSGEAYFDIARDESKPFIIHTGNVKTVVLGTAFNIRAWDEEKQVTVSVTRGKVRVENEKEVLAILTANQQVQYNEEEKIPEKKEVEAKEIVAEWAGSDLVFNSESLQSIATTLSKHFGVSISISDKELANTLIVSSFSGTEPIDSILDILCTINTNSHYTINDEGIVISRK